MIYRIWIYFWAFFQQTRHSTGLENMKNFVPLFQSLDLQHGTNADKRFIASFICIAYLIMLGPISEQAVALWWPLELEFCKMTLF